MKLFQMVIGKIGFGFFHLVFACVKGGMLLFIQYPIKQSIVYFEVFYCLADCISQNKMYVGWTWITGQVLEVVLAKPWADKKTEGVFPYNAGVHPSHLPLAGYGGLSGTPYGSVGARFGVIDGFQQILLSVFVYLFSFNKVSWLFKLI